MMFERKHGREGGLERARDDARHDLDHEREQLRKEREGLERERERLERLQEELEARQEKLEEVEDHLEELEDELDDHEEELESAESIKDVLAAVSQGIGGVVRGIQDAVYSPEQSKQLAQSVAEFYKTLVEAGIPDHQAQALAHNHLANLQHTMLRSTHVRLPHAHRRPASPTGPPPDRVHGPFAEFEDRSERKT